MALKWCASTRTVPGQEKCGLHSLLENSELASVSKGCVFRAANFVQMTAALQFAEKSTFGWRSAFGAALKPLLSAGALAPEVLEFRFSANCSAA